MTDSQERSSAEQPHSTVQDLTVQALHAEGLRVDAHLTDAVRKARFAIFWERLWPGLAGAATAVGLFLALSWLGLWLWLPAYGRVIGLVVFVLLAVAAAWPLVRLRFPSAAEGLRRLDRGSGIAHRPATAVTDPLATKSEDPLTVALWRAHVLRAIAAAKDVKAGWPLPHLALRDPAALRGLVLILVAATFVAAGGERWRRVSAAFDWRGVVTPDNFRVDAWISPPAYTGKSPIILPGLKAGEPMREAVAYEVPVGTILVVRSTGKSNVDVKTTVGLDESEAAARPPAGTEEHRYTINGSSTATVRGPAGDVTWAFNAMPDRPPVIALSKDPESALRGALELNYTMEDDYGVVGAKAEIVRKEAPKDGAKATVVPPHELYGAPELALVLPQARTRNGAGKTVKDMTEHPWAGAEVTMTLVARDEAGQEGRSAPHSFTLPERIFVKPVARSLVELRRIMAMDANTKPRILTALDALTLAPEQFTPETKIYLGLRSIYWNLTRARTDDALREVADRMWSMAVQIEDGNTSDAEQALRAAQERLAQALDRNANDDEIKRLTDELRAALDKFLQALAQEMMKNPQQLARPLDPNTQMLRSQDLRNMIDKLENLARSGNKDAARQMLQELQAMLNNLQMARPGQSQDGDDDMKSLEELADMIRRQQQLRDKTYQQGQDQRRERQRGQQSDKDMGDLKGNQQALRQQLEKMLEEMKKRGMGQNPGQNQAQRGQRGQKGQRGQQGQQGEQGEGDQQGDGGNDGGIGQLGEAGDAMGDAAGQLGDGNADGAVDSQGKALDAMRKGAQGMAQAMQQQQGQGDGPGQGRPGRMGRARADQNTDPLGRPLRGRDYGDDTTVKVPGEIDVQRARRIIEELRRRFSDPARPALELDYIERLLKDF